MLVSLVVIEIKNVWDFLFFGFFVISDYLFIWFVG